MTIRNGKFYVNHAEFSHEIPGKIDRTGMIFERMHN